MNINELLSDEKYIFLKNYFLAANNNKKEDFDARLFFCKYITDLSQKNNLAVLFDENDIMHIKSSYNKCRTLFEIDKFIYNEYEYLQIFVECLLMEIDHLMKKNENSILVLSDMSLSPILLDPLTLEKKRGMVIKYRITNL